VGIVVEPEGRQRGREPLLVAGADEETARPDRLGERPDGGRDDRDAERGRLDRRQGRGRGEERQDEAAGTGDDGGERRERQMRDVGEELSDPEPDGGPGDLGPVLGRGIDDDDPRRPGDRGRERPRAARPGEPGERSEQPREVAARVEAAGVDEVARGELEGGRRGRGGSGGLGRADPLPDRERHDPETRRSDPQEASRPEGRRLGRDDHRRRVAKDPRPEPVAEAGRDAAAERLGELPRRQVEEGDDHREPRGDRDRARGGMEEGGRRPPAGRAAGPGFQARGERGAAKEEGVGRERAGAKEARRR
jgi:hypothetical protein